MPGSLDNTRWSAERVISMYGLEGSWSGTEKSAEKTNLKARDMITRDQ